MSLYHGTSAAAALKILQSGAVLPSTDGYFYCFDSAKPESMAGALCFATGDGPRNGSLGKKGFLEKYIAMNPTFPGGVKGVFAKAALKLSAKSWAKRQMDSASAPDDYKAAILVFPDQPESQPRSRGGFVNEVKVPASALGGMKPEAVYLDDSLLASPDVEKIRSQGVVVKPLSEWADRIWRDCDALKKKGGRYPGPK